MIISVDREIMVQAAKVLEFQHGVYQKYLYKGLVHDVDELLEFASQVDNLALIIKAIEEAVA